MIEYCYVRFEAQTKEQVDDFVSLLREENEARYEVCYPVAEKGYCAEIRELPWDCGDPGEGVQNLICRTIRRHIGKPAKAEYIDTDACRERTTHYDYNGAGLMLREIEGQTLISECEACGVELWKLGEDAEVLITPETVFDVFRCPVCGEILFEYENVNPSGLEYREELVPLDEPECEEEDDMSAFLDAFVEIAEYAG